MSASQELLESGLRLLREEDFARARQILTAVASETAGETSRRATAGLARLDYYDGRFLNGRRIAAQVAEDATEPRVRLEGLLAESINLIALNRGDDALDRVNRAARLAGRIGSSDVRADLRFGLARQLVHVHVARGEYAAAAAAAEWAASQRRRVHEPYPDATVSYLRAVVLAARGDASSVEFFRSADERGPGPSRPFGRWVRYAWAEAERDAGRLGPAALLRASSQLRTWWSVPLFDIASGARPASTTSDKADELPFDLATQALADLVHDHADHAVSGALAAADEFDRCRLRHYARGASMLHAAALLETGKTVQALRLLARESSEMERLGILRWPWWHPKVVRILARSCASDRVSVAFWSRQLRSAGPSERSLTTVLECHGLTPAESRVVESWLGNPTWSRSELARATGTSEPTVRAQLNSARRKLSCDSGRGPDSLRRAIASILDRRVL